MKQGTLVTRIVMVVLFLAVAAYFLGSAWRDLDQRMYTVATYSYTVDDYVEATGLLVRREQVLPAETGGGRVKGSHATGERGGRVGGGAGAGGARGLGLEGVTAGGDDKARV